MMYPSLFEELEAILAGSTSDSARRRGLDYFFMGPARYSIEWISGPDHRTATHLFIEHFQPDSPFWDEAYLKKLSPMLLWFLLADLDHPDAWGESPLHMAYAKNATHPLILMGLQDLLKQIRFNPDAAEDFILNNDKRLIFIQMLQASPTPLFAEKKLKSFCEKISTLKLQTETQPFFKQACLPHEGYGSLNMLTLTSYNPSKHPAAHQLPEFV